MQNGKNDENHEKCQKLGKSWKINVGKNIGKNVGKKCRKKRLPHSHKSKNTISTEFGYNNLSGHFSEIDFEIKPRWCMAPKPSRIIFFFIWLKFEKC